MSISLQSVRSLSVKQRRFLMQHIDGPLQVTVSSHQTRAALIAKKLIRYDRPLHPRHTYLTPDGRSAVSCILADAAEALVSAGLIEAEIAARVAARIKAHAARTTPIPVAAGSGQISPLAPL